MSTSGISFGGLVTGIDTESIISKLMSIEQAPISRWQSQQADIQTKQSAYTQLRAAITALSTSAGTLNSVAAFNPVAANSSVPTTATITTTSDAVAGVYNLTVSALAQAQKISSSGQTDPTSALNLTGTMVVNGKAVSIASSDTLQNISVKINALQTGVTASIIDGGAGNAYLTLASSNSGIANKVQLSDLTGTVATSLGLIGGTAAIREPITGGATSSNFSASDSALQSLLGNAGPGTTTFKINGSSDISVDFSTDTLQTVANKINGAAISGVTASVRSVLANGITTYKLDISGVTATSFTDPGNALSALGITQKPAQKELVPAQDASYSLDNVPLTSSSNSITTAIPGATISLLAANSTTPTQTTLSLTRDDTAVKSKIASFQSTYNQFVDFLTANSKLDGSTYESGPLFGDSVAQQVESSVTNMLFNNVAGASGTYKNLANIGFTLDTDGHLQLDDATLSTALSTAPSSVAALFRTIGSTTDPNLTYVSSTSQTQSTSTGYAVSISQLPTKQSFAAKLQQTDVNPTMETLTFGGALFGSTTYNLKLDIGASLSSTVNKINSDARLKDLMVASINNGALQLDSKKFGTAGNFTIASDQAAATNNSGIGVLGEGTTTLGIDIAGTIGGDAATGNGQFLTSSSTTSATAGLQIQYSGNTLGSAGSVILGKGVSAQVTDLVGTLTDSVSGLLTSMDTTLQTQYNDLQSQIDDLNSRLADKQTELRAKYAAMETAIADIKSQGNSLAGLATSATSSS